MNVPNARRGSALLATLVIVGILGGVLATYFSYLQNQVRRVTLATGRAQALYLAEAGLDAANDALSQNWDAYEDPLLFPMHESVSVSLNGRETSVGEFGITVNPVSPQSLRVTSVGRASASAVQRTLTMVVVRRGKTVFERRGSIPGTLELRAGQFDQDGIPDVLHFTGALDPTDESIPLSGVLSAGGQNALQAGYHLLASFTDVDGDGNLDLVLSDAPSRDTRLPGPFIPSRPLTLQDEPLIGVSVTTADVFHTGMPISVAAERWLFLPEGSLTGSEPGTDVFLNRSTYEGTMIVSWGEPLPSSRSRQ